MGVAELLEEHLASLQILKSRVWGTEEEEISQDLQKLSEDQGSPVVNPGGPWRGPSPKLPRSGEEVDEGR